MYVNDLCRRYLLYGSFIKETATAPEYEEMHPRITMLSSDTLSISSTVDLHDQNRVCLHSWLFHENQFEKGEQCI